MVCGFGLFGEDGEKSSIYVYIGRENDKFVIVATIVIGVTSSQITELKV